MKRERTPGAWYRDPAAADLERWWDGRRWTGTTRPVGATDYLWGSTAPVPPEVPPRRRRPVVVILILSALVVAGGGTGLAVAAASGSRTADAGTPPAAAPLASASAAAADPEPSPPVSPNPSSAAGSALAVLATLPVKGPAPLTGYSRTGDFGAAWLDVDRNGCDTRDDILRRDLVDLDASACRVRAGTLADPYTGRTIPFVRGNTTSAAVQIDHVVALANAWRTGAQRLSQDQRIAFANDRLNLFAVDGPTNQQKGAGDAATWLPPNRAFRCDYVAHQIAVKRAYGLWVVPAERDAMTRVLARCPATPAPADPGAAADTAAAGAVDPGASDPGAADSSAESSSAPAEESDETVEEPHDEATVASDPRYPTCASAERSGAHTPYRRGFDAEYAWYRDQDEDGLVCE